MRLIGLKKWTSKRLATAVFGPLACALVWLSTTDVAVARSPVPYFRGVETIALFCRRPTDRDLRAQLCEAAHGVLQDLVDGPVPVGARGFSDPATITVLINGYEVDGPGGLVVAVTVDLLRKGHVDGRLVGPAPILLDREEVVTPSLRLTDSLKLVLTQTVIDPWRLASPGRDGKDG